MVKFFELTLLASLVAVGSAYPYGFELFNQTNRIVGGVEVQIEDVPWQVSLQSYSSHVCGGSLISKHWAISAAHCVQRSSPSTITLRIGSDKYATGGESVKVKRIVVHEDYDPRTIDFDFSLLELTEPLTFTDKIRAIALPTDDDVIPDGSNCWISGWGVTMNPSESRAKLRGAFLPIVNQEKCIDAYRSTNNVTPRMICAGYEEGGKDSCQGDSGGPMSCQASEEGPRKLIGIVSWGRGCAQASYPGVYSRVQAARQWIQLVAGV